MLRVGCVNCVDVYVCVCVRLQLVKWVEELAGKSDVQPSELKLAELILSGADGDKYPVLTGIPIKSVRFRIAVMQVLNERLAKMMSFIDFVEDQDSASSTSADTAATHAALASTFDARWSLGAKIRAIGYCVFLASKLPLLQACIDATIYERRPDTQVCEPLFA